MPPAFPLPEDAESSGGRNSQAARGDVASLHGENAARRQAITELLFFASVGDLGRCKRICKTWRIQPGEAACCDYDKRTPLHLACAEGCHSVAQWLLEECGADANPIDRFKRTPLEDAVRGDHGEVVALLCARGGRVVGGGGAGAPVLIELADSALAGGARVGLFGALDPEWELDPRAIALGRRVGEGEFGTVYAGNYLGTPVAVKVLKHASAVALGDFRTELNVLQKVRHPHCVQFLGAVTKTSPYMIVTEFMGAGSVADMFRAREMPTLRRAVQLALDCARGVAYLHHRGPLCIIHRDLKPANLLIGGGSGGETDAQRQVLRGELGTIKIADFGLSKSLAKSLSPPDDELPPQGSGDAAAAAKDGKDGGGGGKTPPQKQPHSYKLTGETGSYRYMAPEVFRHELYNHKVDVYSFAVIAFQLFTGVPPFAGIDPLTAARAAAQHGMRPDWRSGVRPGGVPEQLRRVIERCWDADYDARPEMTDVVAQLTAALDAMPPAGGGGGGEGGAGGGGACCSVQ